MSDKTTTTPGGDAANPGGIQPQALDAVSTALGVTVTDEMRAASQIERSEPPAPAAKDPAKPEGAAPAAKTEEKPAAPAADAKAKPDAGGTPKPDEQGKPGAKDKVPTAEEIAAVLDGKPAAGAEGQAAEKKTGDALLDEPISDDVKGRTRERMENLLQRGRESHEKIQAYEAEVAELKPLAEQALGWQDVVVKSGLQPEEFATVMGTMSAINNGTPEQKRQALARIEKFRNDLAAQLGETVPGVDPLTGHEDLRQMVANLEITQERAAELAMHRNRAKAQEQLTGQQEQQQRQVQQARQEQADAEATLNDLGVRLIARDGEAAFNVRKHIAFKSLRNVAKSLPPREWPAAFLDAYAAVPQSVVDNTLAMLRGESGGGGQQHRNVVMSPGGAGGGGGGGGNGGNPRPEVKTSQDAVFAALGLGTPSG